MSETELPVQDHWVIVPGGRLFVRTWSPAVTATETPLLLLHDSLGCVGTWRDFPARLAGRLGRPVVAYDRLGYGRSSARSDWPTAKFIDEEAEVHFPAVRDALGINEYSLLGHSVGGAMALVIAAVDPVRCQSVVTESAQAFVEQRTVDGIRKAKAGFAEPGQLQRLARWHGNKANWVLQAWTGIWLSSEFALWSLATTLPHVACPVLAIHGDRDEYGSAAFPQMITRCSGGPARLIMLRGCGHVPHRERAGQVLAQVAAFLP